MKASRIIVLLLNVVAFLQAGCEVFIYDVGGPGQPCLDNGKCNEGLVCLDNVCRDPSYDCAGRECGPSPNLIADCGTCQGATDYCSPQGQCMDDCLDLECGSSPNRGFDCGSCSSDTPYCHQSGICVSDLCDPDPCSGHGTCSGGACTCSTGYAGASCDQCAAGYIGYPNCVDDPCDPDPCSGHGTCSGGACACDTGYAGASCNQCAAGYIGYPNCVDDPCDPDPCSGHGDCADGSCSCNTGYAGTTCDACTAGYIGYPNCVDDPCDPDPCSGHGDCANGSCSCNTGYAGAACDQCDPAYGGGYPACDQCAAEALGEYPYCFLLGSGYCDTSQDCPGQICAGDSFEHYCSAECDAASDPATWPAGYRCVIGPSKDYYARDYAVCGSDADCSPDGVCTYHEADDQLSIVSECRPAHDPGASPGDDCSASTCANGLCSWYTDLCTEICSAPGDCNTQYLGHDTACVFAWEVVSPGDCGRDEQCPAGYSCQSAHCLGPTCTDDWQCQPGYACSQVSPPAPEKACQPQPFYDFIGQCRIACVGDPDCPSGMQCHPAVLVDSSVVQGFCRVPPTGTTIATGGGPCGGGYDPCSHGICYGSGASSYCTQLCGQASDCPGGVMNCTAGPLNMGNLGSFPGTLTCTNP